MKHVLFGSALKSAMTIIVILLVGAAGVAVAYGTGVLGGVASDGISASPSVGASGTPSPSASASATVAADTIVVPRPVTTGPGVPSASELHDATFTAVTSGWVLTVFDAGTYNSSHNPVPGARILYLISPAGDRYELGAFPASEQVDLAAWNVAAGKALLEVGGAHYAVYDIATGALGPDWALCGDHPVTASVTPQADGNWEFRGYCIGAQVDGVYSDTGADVSPAGFYRAPFQRWDVDLENGAVAIYDSESSHPSVIVSFPGSDEPSEMFWPSGVDSCVPLGVGRFNAGGVVSTIAVGCIHGSHASAWELHATGEAPTPLVTEAQVDSFTGAVTGPGAPRFVGNCVVNSIEILEVATTGQAAAYSSGGGLTQPGLSEFVGADHCWGGSGPAALFSGHGSLWTYVQGGATVPLAVVSGSLNPGDIIGVADTRSAIAP